MMLPMPSKKLILKIRRAKRFLAREFSSTLQRKMGIAGRGGKSSSEGGVPGGRLVDQSGLCDAVI